MTPSRLSAVFLPRAPSKTVYLFVTACYGFTIETLEGKLIAILRLWPVTVDPVRHAVRPVRPGIDGAKIIDLLFLAPALESLFVIGIIELLRYFRLNVWIQLGVSTLAICLLHSCIYSFWGFVVAPSFLLGAATYVYWRRNSFWTGALMIIMLHACLNFPPFLTILADYARR